MMQIDIYKIIYIPYFFLVFFVVVGSHDMLSTLDALLPDRSFGFRSFVFFLNDNNFEGVSFGVNFKFSTGSERSSNVRQLDSVSLGSTRSDLLNESRL